MCSSKRIFVTQEKIYGYNKKYIISKFDEEFSIERNGATTA